MMHVDGVHAEQNAMLSAPRKDMIDSSLFLVGISHTTNTYVENPTSCQMCRKLIINSGIKDVYVRIDNTSYKKIEVQEWIDHDELLEGKIEY